MTWHAGRQLSEITKNDTAISYKYNDSGIRTEKLANGVKTEYYIIGDTIAAEKRSDGIKIIYLTDESGVKIGFTISGSSADGTYYYIFNAQGDVIGIYNSAGEKVVEYSYDSWGKLLSVTGSLVDSIGEINPIRYRGYYYDAETGFYYLQSRYYAPEVGRFINADSLLNQKSTLGNNLFAYCLNNPINMSDTTGDLPFFLITAAIGAVVGSIIGGITAAKNGENIWAGIGIGAATGGLIGAGLGAITGVMLAGSATAGVASVVLGGKAAMSVVSSAGIVAGTKMLADNIYQVYNNTAQVFWSGGEVAKNAAQQLANNIGGKTLEMTQLGTYLEQIDANYSTWQAASLNFANVARNSHSIVYSIQNIAGVWIQSTWATIEYPLLTGIDIIYGIASQNGYIQILP